MSIKIYVVNAFSDRAFSGNPAGVVLLEKEMDSDILKRIVAESNLPEISFISKIADSNCYNIRWFTSQTELDICGHGTLGAAHIVLSLYQPHDDEVVFEAANQRLCVRRVGERYVMMLPAISCEICTDPQEIALVEAAVMPAEKIYKGRSYVLWLKSKKEVVNFSPDFIKLRQLSLPGIIIAAPGDNEDYVCRYFAPQKGINEDPVTGTAHCTLAPLFSAVYLKNKLSASQLSKRGGNIGVEVKGKVIELTGQAFTAMEITLF
ncbi:PhzF family phenazine biosynthesis protein [Pectobacterium aquaticum]|uniref:PhzF family phenazine biosynthesis protein n=1 Tax=Pectobacterium aquaticum TaxID=2204145 RepID=UPI000E27BA9B|nr:PhzF family phenazine biosynthesis protein [Pectobacterium aquaticum]MCH5052523.1 PhzF family phenazine biosynthesis protein [Pectobacterium aquaticum]UEM39391.1 PhzF family phenazine biosynthesis protein [Pectobacterium aquaticum]